MKFLVRRDYDNVIDRWYIFNSTADRWNTKFARSFVDAHKWRKVKAKPGSLLYDHMIRLLDTNHVREESNSIMFSPIYTDEEFDHFIQTHFIELL